MTDAERRDLERMARDAGKAVATVIREAVNEYVGDYSERVPFDDLSSGKKIRPAASSPYADC